VLFSFDDVRDLVQEHKELRLEKLRKTEVEPSDVAMVDADMGEASGSGKNK
jgi:hypothetical protein